MTTPVAAVPTGPQTSATPAAPSTNGASGHATPGPAPGATSGTGAVRGPDGKFQSANGTPAPAPAAPPSDSWKRDLGDGDGEREYTAEQIRTWKLKSKANDKFASSAAEKLREAQALRQQHDATKAAIRARDVGAFMEATGVSEDEALQFFESGLLPAIERQQMSPEQRRIAELEAEAGKYRKQNEQRQQVEHQARYEREVGAIQAQMEGQIVEALVGLKIDPSLSGALISRVADRLFQAKDIGVELSQAEVAQLVVDEYRGAHKSVAGSLSYPKMVEFYGLDPSTLWPEAMTGEEVVAALPPAVMLKIRKAEYLRLKSRGQSATPPPAPSGIPAQAKPTNAYKTPEEVRRIHRFTTGD